MRTALILSFSLLLSGICYSQKKKDKHFKEGYVIRFDDTIRCKIYVEFWGYKMCHEVTFRYPDGREITYNPGSAIKGFGFKMDSVEKHYYVFPVEDYYIDGKKNSSAYGEVISTGPLRLFKYMTYEAERKIRSGGIINYLIVQLDIRYFLHSNIAEKATRIGINPVFGDIYFTKDQIKIYIADYRELLEEIKEDEKIKIKQLSAYIDRYNQWKEQTKTISQ
jgi:hypothetical protein